MLGTVELITFAIQGALHLARAGRKIYVEDTILKEVGIPFPTGFSSEIAAALLHAEAVRRDERPRFDSTFAPFYTTYHHDQSTAEEVKAAKLQLIQLYLLDLGQGRVASVAVNREEIAGLAALRQWEKGTDPFPHPLQRVAGALVEVAIDFSLQVPGALQETSKQGRAIRAFLEGLDQFDFQEERWDSIVVRLFTAALETAKDHSEILPASEAAQQFLAPILKGVAKDLQTKLEKLGPAGDLDGEARIAAVGETLLRSLLRNTGATVVRNPAALGVGSAAGGAMIQEVGSTMIDLLIPADADGKSLGETLEAALSGDGMDRLLGSALQAVVEHPESFPMGSSTLTPFLKGILSDLHENHQKGGSFFDKDLYVDLANLVLDAGVRDLPLFLGRTNGAKGLLVDIVREVYDALTVLDDDGRPKWKLDLSRGDVMAVFTGILTSVSDHPEWIERDPQRQAKFAAALKLGVEVWTEASKGGLKELLRKELLSTVLVPALSSGLLEKVSEKVAARIAKTEKVVTTLVDVLTAVQEGGTRGLSSLLQPDRLTDLLAALADDAVLESLLGKDAAAAKKATKALLAIVDGARKSKLLTYTEMAKKLAPA